MNMDAKEAGVLFLIFFTSFIFCIIPKFLTKTQKIRNAFPYIIFCAAGFMLAVMLLDFIPHLNGEPCKAHNKVKQCPTHKCDVKECPSSCASKIKADDDHHKHDHSHKHDHGNKKKDNDHGHSHKQNWGLFAAGLSFIFLLAIDSMVLKHSHCDNKEIIENHKLHSHNSMGSCNTEGLKYATSKVQAFIFVLAISIHSFFEGLACEMDGKLSTYMFGLIIHKVLESFALGFTIFSTTFSTLHEIFLVAFYSSLTPLGMVVGSFKDSHIIISQIANGLALGSLLFIVCIEMIQPNFHSVSDSIAKVAALSVGYVFTSIVIMKTHG